MILYGYGCYAKENITSELWERIEVIIDNGIDEKIINDKPVIKWKDYLIDHSKYASNKIVIALLRDKDVVYREVIESNLFPYINVYTLDRYITEKQLLEAGQIKSELLSNARLLNNREDVLQYIDKKGVAVEVGVAYGDFSECIMDIINPKKFYAIDLFDSNGAWEKMKFSENYTHEEWYRDKFKKQVDEGVLETLKGLSWECLSKMEDDSVDYLYLDAGHDYESVMKDLMEARRVVRHNGIIQFNDYIIYDYLLNSYYGVVQAVNNYVNSTNSEVLFYCMSTSGFDDIVVRNRKM